MSFDREAALAAMRAMEFQEAGSIELPAGASVPGFRLNDSFGSGGRMARDEGWVYLWAQYQGDQLVDVCYVGKAGKTLRARCDQHVGGFKGSSKKGESNGHGVRAFLSLSPGHRIRLFARKSPVARILDEDDVSLCEAEERAVIAKMRRLGASLWNA